jgi:hypothetical protein
MEKDKAIKYNKFKRERSLSDNEKMILEQVSKKSRFPSILSTESPASSPASLTAFSASLDPSTAF